MVQWTASGVLPARQELAQQRQLLVNPTDGRAVLEEHLRHLLG
jgi:hypothetical protein